MKKFYSGVLALLPLIATVGCKKAYDYIEINPSADLKCCSILKLSYSDPWGTVDSIRFTYNSGGDPVTGIRPGPRTGAPNYEFRYDKRGRLTSFIGFYGNGGTEFWHIYFYDGMGQIVRDSNYIFCRVENGRPVDPRLTPEPDLSTLTCYSYDFKGRIIADSTIFLDGYIIVNHYSYDAKGNRTGTTYDQKTSLRRTNKIWMFLDRDYSLNNPFVADSYNSMGLPTQVNLAIKEGTMSFAGNYFSQARITYNCK